MNFNILTKKFEVFKDITMKKAPELVIPHVDVRIDNFQFQNIDTYNWNFIGLSISNDSLLTIF